MNRNKKMRHQGNVLSHGHSVNLSTSNLLVAQFIVGSDGSWRETNFWYLVQQVL